MNKNLKLLNLKKILNNLYCLNSDINLKGDYMEINWIYVKFNLLNTKIQHTVIKNVNQKMKWINY